MSMDWSEEPWVKLYIRDTVQWLMLPWQAQGLLCLLFRKVNRAGVLDYGDVGLPGVARVIAGSVVLWPEMEPFFAKLLANGVVVDEPTRRRLVIPKFVEAQRARQSAKLRAKTMREREAAGLKEPTPRKRPHDEPPALPPDVQPAAPHAPPAPAPRPTPIPWDDIAQALLKSSKGRINVTFADVHLQEEFREQCRQLALKQGALTKFGEAVAKNPKDVWTWLKASNTPKVFDLDWLRHADESRQETPWKRLRQGLAYALGLPEPTEARPDATRPKPPATPTEEASRKNFALSAVHNLRTRLEDDA